LGDGSTIAGIRQNYVMYFVNLFLIFQSQPLQTATLRNMKPAPIPQVFYADTDFIFQIV
jgi:hypothetical protein